MANLQEKILSIQNPVLKPFPVNIDHITECFGNLISSSNEFAKILEQKQSMQHGIDKIIYDKWKDISNAIRKILLPAQSL